MPTIFRASAGTLLQHDQPPSYQPSIASDQNFLGAMASMPYYQFLAQQRREEDRLHYRLITTRCIQHFPLFERTKSFEANAGYIVRARWVDQGIWEDSWDPAQPADDSPEPAGPWEWQSPCPWGPWSHERPAVPPRQPTPEPEPAPRIRNIFGPPSASTAPAKPPVVPKAIIAQTRTARDPEASRPRPQFLYQVAKEREWLEFEITSKKLPVEGVDLDTLAYCSVKRFWEESFIWNDAWDDLPGDFWMHEAEQSSEPLPTPPPDDAAPPPYEYATRTRAPRARKQRVGSAPVRRSDRIAARRVRRAAEEEREEQPRKRLRRV